MIHVSVQAELDETELLTNGICSVGGHVRYVDENQMMELLADGGGPPGRKSIAICAVCGDLKFVRLDPDI